MAEAGGGIGLQFGLPDLPELHDQAAAARFQMALGSGAPGPQPQAPAPVAPGSAAAGSAAAAELVPPGLAPPVQGAAAGEALPNLPGRAALPGGAPVLADATSLLPQAPAGAQAAAAAMPPVTAPQPGSFASAADLRPPLSMQGPIPTATATATATASPTPAPAFTPMPMPMPAPTAPKLVPNAPIPLPAAPRAAPTLPVQTLPAPAATTPALPRPPAIPPAPAPFTPPPAHAAPAAAPAAAREATTAPSAALPYPPAAPQPAVPQGTAPAAPSANQPPAAALAPAAPSAPGLSPSPGASANPPQAVSAAPPADVARPLAPAPAASAAPVPHTAVIQPANQPLAQPAPAQAAGPLQATNHAAPALRVPGLAAAGLLAVPDYAFALPLVPAIQSPYARNFQHLRAYRRPPQPDLYWALAQPHAQPHARGGAPRRLIAYTDHRPVPLDLAPHTPLLASWRLDDTEALILTGDAAAGPAAAALHARLMEHALPLLVLRPGEGVATWEGSPLWLRLAGIAKPADQGILLSESAPARVQVLRLDEGWEISRIRAGVTFATRTLPSGAALPEQIVFGDPAAATGAAEIRAARALPEPRRGRVQEAWAAVRRLETRLAAANGGPLRHRLGALVPHGQAVLGRVLNGEVNGIDALDGIALAAALDRLPVSHAAGALAS